MRTEVIRLSDISETDFAAWSELTAAAHVPNPFTHSDYVGVTARGLSVDDVGLLVVRQGSEWLAALPVRDVRSWHGVPGRALVAWVHTYCYLGTPLVRSDGADASLRALIERALRTAGCLILDLIDDAQPDDDPLARALTESTRHLSFKEFDRAVLRRGEELEAPLSSHHRNEYARKFRRLQNQAGEVSLVDRSDDPDAYRQFLVLESSGWKGRSGSALGSKPDHAQYFVELCESLAQDRRLQLLSLASEDHTVAMMCNVIAQDVAFGFKLAFDDRFAKVSPGIHLLQAYARAFDHGDLSYMDSCGGPLDQTLRRLWVGRRRIRSVVAAHPGVAGTPVYLKWRAAIKTAPMRTRLLERRQAAVPGAPQRRESDQPESTGSIA